MSSRREIRIVIQGDVDKLERGQEAAIRTIFGKYFAGEGYRVSVTLLVSQLFGVLINGFLTGGNARTALLVALGIGMAQTALRGVILSWTKSPQPPVQNDS